MNVAALQRDLAADSCIWASQPIEPDYDLVGWLSAAEIRCWQRFRSTARQNEWYWGRRLLKQTLLDNFLSGDVRPRSIKIESEARRKGVRPAVYIDSFIAPYSTSISHTHDAVFVAATANTDIRVGIDVLHKDHSISRSFQHAWFTCRELRGLQESGQAAGLVWAAKEAVYKAVNEGEPFAPRQVECVFHSIQSPRVFYHGVALGGRCRLSIHNKEHHLLALAKYHRAGCSKITRKVS